MQYNRILLKLSGESLMGNKQFGIDADKVLQYAKEIKEVADQGLQIAIVIGGGNIFRGIQAEENGIDRVQGDYMGMLATMINSMALQSALEKLGVWTRLVSAIEMKTIAEPFIKRRAVRHLEKNRVVIFGAGTGNPYFTTDTAAVLRATEIEADVIIKGTRVDGIYNSDPEKNPKAKKYDTLSYSDALRRKLNVMDLTAFTLCQENHLPIIVFNINKIGNLQKVVHGEKVGTIVTDRKTNKKLSEKKSHWKSIRELSEFEMEFIKMITDLENGKKPLINEYEKFLKAKKKEIKGQSSNIEDIRYNLSKLVPNRKVRIEKNTSLVEPKQILVK